MKQNKNIKKIVFSVLNSIKIAGEIIVLTFGYLLGIALVSDGNLLVMVIISVAIICIFVIEKFKKYSKRRFIDSTFADISWQSCVSFGLAGLLLVFWCIFPHQMNNFILIIFRHLPDLFK